MAESEPFVIAVTDAAIRPPLDLVHHHWPFDGSPPISVEGAGFDLSLHEYQRATASKDHSPWHTASPRVYAAPADVLRALCTLPNLQEV